MITGSSVDAGRVDPLPRRHRQPGAVAPRAPARRPARPTTRTTFGYGRRAITSGPSSSRSCSSRWARCSRSTKGSSKIDHPTRSSSPMGDRHPRDRDGARGLVVPHRVRGVRGDERPPARGAVHPPDSNVPELPVVLLEDLGALIGLVIALARADDGVDHRSTRSGTASARSPSASCSSSSRLVLAIEMKSLLIGEAATPRWRRRSRWPSKESASVDQLIHLRTEHLGTGEILPRGGQGRPERSRGRGRGEGDRCRRSNASGDRVPSACAIYIEPDEFRGERDPYGLNVLAAPQ